MTQQPMESSNSSFCRGYDRQEEVQTVRLNTSQTTSPMGFLAVAGCMALAATMSAILKNIQSRLIQG